MEGLKSGTWASNLKPRPYDHTLLGSRYLTPRQNGGPPSGSPDRTKGLLIPESAAHAQAVGRRLLKFTAKGPDLQSTLWAMETKTISKLKRPTFLLIPRQPFPEDVLLWQVVEMCIITMVCPSSFIVHTQNVYIFIMARTQQRP